MHDDAELKDPANGGDLVKFKDGQELGRCNCSSNRNVPLRDYYFTWNSFIRWSYSSQRNKFVSCFPIFFKRHTGSQPRALFNISHAKY